jgi:methyl coenzyme M reductase beta subunit
MMHPSLSGLKDLLEREHDEIKKGNFPNLSDIADEKERLLSDSSTLQHSSPSESSAIHQLAQRNERALASARAGIESAAARVHELRSAAAGYRVYGPDGDCKHIPSTER